MAGADAASDLPRLWLGPASSSSSSSLSSAVHWLRSDVEPEPVTVVAAVEWLSLRCPVPLPERSSGGVDGGDASERERSACVGLEVGEREVDDGAESESEDDQSRSSTSNSACGTVVMMPSLCCRPGSRWGRLPSVPPTLSPSFSDSTRAVRGTRQSYKWASPARGDGEFVMRRKEGAERGREGGLSGEEVRGPKEGTLPPARREGKMQPHSNRGLGLRVM